MSDFAHMQEELRAVKAALAKAEARIAELLGRKKKDAPAEPKAAA